VAKQRVLVGLNYPDGKGGEKRAEPGDIVDDLPERSVKGLQKNGYVEPASERSRAKKAAATRSVNEAVEAADQPAEIPDKLDEIREED
jgi:hypothetical protein